MASRTEEACVRQKVFFCGLFEVFFFSSLFFQCAKLLLWESQGKTIKPVQVHCFRTGLNTTSNVSLVLLVGLSSLLLLLGFFFPLFFGSWCSSPPRR